MRNARHKKEVPPKLLTSSRLRHAGTIATISLAVFFAAGLAAGCAGVVGQAQTTNAPVTPQSHKISGTIAPVASGSNATVTLSGSSASTTTADASGNYIFAGLPAGTYLVSPNKTGFSFSPGSQSVTVGTTDITAINFSATALQAHSTVLSWLASTSSVAGYNVYRSTTDGGPYTLLTSAPIAGVTFTDDSVQSGQTYFYVTTSVDSSGAQSTNSNQVQAVIP